MRISPAIKPFLLLDISMNNMIGPVFEELKKVEDSLPPKLKNRYYIDKYNFYNNKIFKYLYDVQKAASSEKTDMEEVMNIIMEDFYNELKDIIDRLYLSFVRFITQSEGEGMNIEILSRLQINSLLIETALLLAKKTTGAKPMLIGQLLEINNVFIARVDNRKKKLEYDDDEELDTLSKELSKKIINYKWNSESFQKTRSSAASQH